MLAEHVFDVMMTDVALPDTPGNELAAMACQRQPDLRILFASGYESVPGSTGSGYELQARFIQKPYDEPALVEALEALLDGAK
jgi:FixJ family two-component response regulator